MVSSARSRGPGAGGDRDAFSELAARSIGRLTAVARMILRDEYAAQDAVQDAFIEAWRSLPGLREPDQFEAWMRRLLVRACFKGIRRSKRVGAVEIALTPADEPAIAGGERELDIHDQLERGLARLSPTCAPSSSSSTTSTCRSPMPRRRWASRSGRRSPGSTGRPRRCARTSKPTTASRRGVGEQIA